mgnify:CR=1 FL=1
MKGWAGQVSAAETSRGGSRADRAYDLFRREIVACRLAPGARLTEPDLAARYDVGKASLRVALQRLSQEGFVTSIPRQGYRVVPVTLRDVDEVFALRLELEPLAARLAAGRVDRARLEALERACRDRSAATIPEQIDDFLEANRAFHMAIAEAGGNRRLCRMLSELLDEMSRLVALGFGAENERPNIERDHVQLIDHLDAGEAEAAAEVARRHVETFRAMTLDKVMTALNATAADMPLPRVGPAGRSTQDP